MEFCSNSYGLLARINKNGLAKPILYVQYIATPTGRNLTVETREIDKTYAVHRPAPEWKMEYQGVNGRTESRRSESRELEYRGESEKQTERHGWLLSVGGGVAGALADAM